jgi:hypothetical protein
MLDWVNWKRICRLRNISTIFVIGLFLTACATQPTPAADDPPGFFMGLIHGIVSSFALIGSIFMDIRVYAFPNSGVLYDLGFSLGILLCSLIVFSRIIVNQEQEIEELKDQIAEKEERIEELEDQIEELN